ncbi:two-component regulator propeller domain-containing protein [Archangium lansingense]|uniref:histidine kinase n=1 Tax=Archangium lansingense TaxID=2995310 RepID=A0ABT4AMS0_9BACT|nr:two-component regulator propeller domain-containing protein [Archangium lansinium]MCY1082871.1 ATP-binding protein [Archangium lansinium]
MHGLRALTLAVVMSLGASALALDPSRRVTQYSHDSWKDVDGLPQNSVYALAQTRDGYLWVATWEGLVRFDGVHFTVYDKRNTPELREELIGALAEDLAGTLWVGTARGLLSFREGRFQSLELAPGPSEVEVLALAPGGDGSVWVGTSQGLFQVRDGRRQLRYGTSEGLPSAKVYALLKDQRGVLWVGTEKGLARLSEGRLEPVRLPGGTGRGVVRSLLEDHEGALWVGTESGLVRFQEDRVRLFTTRDGLPGDKVRALTEDRDGNLWVGTEEAGLARLADDTFAVLGPQQGLAGAGVFSLLEDHEGSLWVGTASGGLHRLRDAAFVAFGQPEGLRDELVSVVLEDKQGALWVGSYSGGLTRMKDGELTHFGQESGLPPGNLRALAEDRDGNLWVGTSAGAFRYDGRSFTRLGREQGLVDEVLFSLFADSRGDVWFGTLGGLSRLHEGTFTHYGPAQGGPEEPVVSIAEDSTGTLWFGSFGGLYRLTADGTFTHYTTADGLAGNRVVDVYADPRGSLWVGSSTGLTLMRGGRFTRFTTAQGLVDDAVFRILEDAEGHLWMSSNRGISRVSRRELEEIADGHRDAVRPLLFDRRDGMRSAECNGGMFPSGWRTRDGQLWFPTLRGLVAVEPSKVVVQRPLAQPRLEEVRVQGRPVPIAGTLVLEPGRRDVEFRFTALSLEDSTRPPMRYRLIGHDEDWVDGEDRRSVSYTNLSPGNYRFMVTAANRDAVWTDPGPVVELTVLPHYYETPWFFVLCTLGVGALAVGLYALRVGRLKRRERWLEARVDERTRELARANRELDENLRALRQAQAQLVQAGKMVAVGTLAAGVGHEINNPLAYIVSNLDHVSAETAALKRELPEGVPGRKRLEEMERALSEARHGADRVRRIVQDLKTFSRGDEEQRGPVDLHAVLDSAAKLASNELTPRARLVKEYGDSGWVDGNESRLAQVFLNLIINSAQALPEGQAASNEVRLVTRLEGERLVAEVRDTGCGIPPDVIGRIFDPFFTTKPVGVGTGLGLALCHRFITAMGGEIAVESEPGKGTVVRVTLRVAAAPVSQLQGVRSMQQEQEGARVRGRVMIVDDDVMVSSALRRTLAREHDVEVVTSSRQALELLKGPKGAEVDVILCDLMMPDLTGMELHADLVESAPAVAKRMVFVTGGAFTPAARTFMDTVKNARVDKPFDPQVLREQVREWVIRSRNGGPGQAA